MRINFSRLVLALGVLGSLLLGGLAARAGVPTVTFTIQNNSACYFPGSSSYLSMNMWTTYTPNGWSGGCTVWPSVPPLAPGGSTTITVNVSGASPNYPTCAWVQFAAGSSQTPQETVSQPGGYNGAATCINTILLNYCAGTVGDSLPIVMTNYTFTIQNTMAVNGLATWTYNGSIVKQESLSPGQSDSWTTPSLEVSPVPQNFTMNAAIVAQDTSLGYTNGVLGFLPDNSGNSVTFTNSSGSLTTFSNGSGGFVSASTNSPILWQPSPGTAAQDSTLKGGFDALQQDANNNLAALDILHNDLLNINNSIKAQTNGGGPVTVTNNISLNATNAADLPLLGQIATNTYNLNTIFGSYTNAAGQQVAYLAYLSNDVMVISQIATNNGQAIATNSALQAQEVGDLNSISNSLEQLLQSTNADIATESTQAGISNLLGQISGVLSNGFASLGSNQVAAATNQTLFTLTNYATETTLAGISNLLATNHGMSLEEYTNYMNPSAIQTNLLAQLPAQLANTNAAQALADTSGIKNLANNMPGVGIDSGGSVSPQNINLGHGIVIAMGSGVPTAFNAVRGLIAWCIIIVLIFSNYKTSIDACSAVLQTPQATTAGEEVLGTNANAASAIAMGLLIVATASGVPAIAAGFMANELALVSTTNPLNFLESALGWGYSFLSQYIPIYTLGTALCSRFAFYVIVRGVALVAAGVVKLLTGI